MSYVHPVSFRYLQQPEFPPPPPPPLPPGRRSSTLIEEGGVVSEVSTCPHAGVFPHILWLPAEAPLPASCQSSCALGDLRNEPPVGLGASGTHCSWHLARDLAPGPCEEEGTQNPTLSHTARSQGGWQSWGQDAGVGGTICSEEVNPGSQTSLGLGRRVSLRPRNGAERRPRVRNSAPTGLSTLACQHRRHG